MNIVAERCSKLLLDLANFGDKWIISLLKQFFRRADQGHFKTSVITNSLDSLYNLSIGDVATIPSQEVVYTVNRHDEIALCLHPGGSTTGNEATCELRQYKMHIGRAFRVINLLDIPEHKRKFWPQFSLVVVDPTNQSILDVMQYSTCSSDECNRDIRAYYPVCIAFSVTANQLDSVEKLQDKIEWHCKSVGKKAYIVGTAERLRAASES